MFSRTIVRLINLQPVTIENNYDGKLNMEGSERKLRSSCESLTSTLPSPSDNSLIQVKARALTKDESTGLWKQIKGNPVAIVNLKKEGENDYYITAHRLQEHQELFNCKLKPNTHYQRGDATFHHWNIDSQKHGLTFLHMGEARRFEQLVRKAIADISPSVGSVSEEDIFLKPEDTRDIKVPLRPHKPRRLTEEYRVSESKDSLRQHKSCSSSSEEESRCVSQPLPASVDNPTVLIIDTSQPPTPHLTQPTSHSSPEHAKGVVSSPEAASTGEVIPKKGVDADKALALTPGGITRDTSSKTNSNIYVIQTGSAASPGTPPAHSTSAPSRTAKSPKPVSLPAVPCRGQYSDYRNDYYMKQGQQRAVEIESQRDSDDLTDLNLKAVKNTPPLPRKKKRHRQGMQLCCFRIERERNSDESV